MVCISTGLPAEKQPSSSFNPGKSLLSMLFNVSLLGIVVFQPTCSNYNSHKPPQFSLESLLYSMFPQTPSSGSRDNTGCICVEVFCGYTPSSNNAVRLQLLLSFQLNTGLQEGWGVERVSIVGTLKCLRQVP